MTVLVTGASGGIGAAVARRLAHDGRRVLAHDLRVPDDGASEEADGDIRRLAGDLRSDDCLDELALLMAQEQVSAVVAAHGVDGSGALASLEPQYVQRVMDINFTAVTRLHAAAQPTLARTGGAFVAVSSANGLLGEAENSAYCASKFALVGWARAITQRLSAGTPVHVICPGCTDTPLLRDGLAGFAAAQGRQTEEVVAEYLQSIPAGRFAAVEEIAGAIACLLELDCERGVVWAVTGGQVLA